MANHRIQKIARKLKEEAESFVDYRQIENETTKLGFPTSVRTLRFYVSEGILPPPRRVGKSPVYPREWILNVLLAVHLMKSRLRRSLSEIRAVLQHLSEDPETLADKCTELYELVTEPGNLSPTDARWLLDRFFGILSASGRGAGVSSRKKVAGATSPLQPSEVLVTDLLEELESRGVPAGTGQSAPGRSSALASRGRSPRLVAPDASSRGASLRRRSRGEAQHLENLFIRRFETGFRALKSIYHPIEAKSYPTRSSAGEPLIADEYLRVVEVLKEARCFDRELFDSLPLNKSTQFNVWSGRVVQRKLKLSLVGASWSPIAQFVHGESSMPPAGATELYRLLDRFVVDRSVFHYIALHSTVGWDPVLTRHPPGGQNYLAALVEYDDEIGWSVHHGFPAEATGLVDILDPEPFAEKVERCKRRIEDLRELRVRGGFVAVDTLPALLRVDREVVTEALGRLQANDLRLATVRGRKILKRERLGARASGVTDDDSKREGSRQT